MSGDGGLLVTRAAAAGHSSLLLENLESFLLHARIALDDDLFLGE